MARDNERLALAEELAEVLAPDATRLTTAVADLVARLRTDDPT